MPYAQQSCKNVIANIRILVFHKFYIKKETKKKKQNKTNNNTCKSEPIGFIIFLVELLYVGRLSISNGEKPIRGLRSNQTNKQLNM